MSAMTAVASVAAMQEQMQKRAGEQKEIRQNAERMRPVLREEKEGADQQKGNRHETCLRSPEAGLRRLGCSAGFRIRSGVMVIGVICLAQGSTPSLWLEEAPW
jgi:hypothetical protein